MSRASRCPGTRAPVSRSRRTSSRGDGCPRTQAFVDSTCTIHPRARDLLFTALMSKRPSRRRSGTTDRSTTTDVVSQLECAIKHPHAALIGALIGGLVPWFGRSLAHAEIPSAWSAGNHGLAAAMLAVVLGCCAFSGLSVYKFGKAAFGDSRKALGFVLALEGVMVVSHGATSCVALAVLVLINAVSNGSVIALSREATQRRCEADARRAATRAKSRSTRTKTAPTTSTTSQPSKPVGSTALVTAPQWAPFDASVIDAEIVSEVLS